MVVTESHADRLVCEVVHEGTFRTRQGINLPGAKISLPALTQYDRQCAEWAATSGADFVSLSFVRSPDELIELRALLSRHGGVSAPVIAKIEKPEAIDRPRSDRRRRGWGDGGSRGSGGGDRSAEIPVAQKEIIRTCQAWRKPVIVATQMLDSMQDRRGRRGPK